MILIALLSAVCLSAGARTYLRGDADGDGEISSLDVTVVQRVVAGIITDSDGSITERGAVTGGDSLTLPDATQIQRYLAGLTNCNVGEPASDIVFPTEDNQLPILTTE
ncbi:MAG: hypothetical protein IJG87_03375 [Ruminococcus sp.]|nr:hypothetical protein [Ruminococcus sp.]